MDPDGPVLTGCDRVVYKGKVVVVGDYSSGKTSLVHRYGAGNYLGIQEPTIAAAFQTKVVDLLRPAHVPRFVTDAHHPSGVVGRSFWSDQGPNAAVFDNERRAAEQFGTAAGRLATRRGHLDPGSDDATATQALHDPRDCVVKLELWDTAGSERYQSLMPMYFRDASVALLVFDVTRRETFEHVPRWLDAYQQHNDRSRLGAMRAVIVAAKCDLYSYAVEGDRSKELGGPDKGGSAGPRASTAALPEVSLQEIHALGHQLGLPVCFTSAKADWNVQLLFRDVATHIAAISERGLLGRGKYGLGNGAGGSATLLQSLARDSPDINVVPTKNGQRRRKDGCCGAR